MTWPDMGRVALVVSQTLRTSPAAVYDPRNGHIVVRLFDRNAQPLVGRTVSLSGPATGTQASSADGCAFAYPANPVCGFTR